jgi:hypothetical protein
VNGNPEIRPTRLADSRVNPPVFIPATIIRRFPPARLPEVETAWSPARLELAMAVQASGSDLESSHWNWKFKVERVERGELALFAVECEGAIQGLMASPTRPRPAVLTPRESVVYIDYLEAAPWNLHAPGRLRRFGGVGSALITEAIIMSMELGFHGRVGLHSLPQAERFYFENCRMRRIGTDPAYYDLVYFKYTEEAGTAFLVAEGMLK